VKLLLKILLCLSVPISLSLGEVPNFKKGDRVTFIGDSITHGGSYHPNIYLFYATRFPTSPFSVYNCGISGDTTIGTNKRFEADIARHNPNVTTIMLGMNDAWSWCYGENTPTKGMLKGRKDSYKTFTREYRLLADSLKKKNCRLIFIKPSIYDQTAKLKTPILQGKDDQLVRFGEFIEDLAPKYDASIVDFHSLMTEINGRLQKENPTATVVGHDRVHPGAAGHFVMSYAFLKAQKMPTYVSKIELDASAKKITASTNFDISQAPRFTPESISFAATEQALPFPVSKDQQQALAWVPFQKEFNQQTIKIQNLPPGSYQLHIDELSVGTYSAKEFSSGINLSSNKATPQYQQSLKVLSVHRERLAVTAKLRSIAHVRHTMVRKIRPPLTNPDHETLKTALTAHVEESKGKPWYGYIKKQMNTFLEFYPQEEKLREEEERLMKQLWIVNQPESHHWNLIPISQ